MPSIYLSLLLWIIPLLLSHSGPVSMMPQDEAMYGIRARLMLESGDWITPQSWGELVYEKTPGPYWWLGLVYKLFGISEVSSRLPAQIACVFSIILTYEIAKILLGSKRLAWLSAAILGVSFLWLQGSRLTTANIPTMCAALLGIWCLLKAESPGKSRFYWSFAAGFSVGIGFLFRGQLIFLPFIGLLPYLIVEHRRHKHLTNPMLYLGLLFGLLPTIIWFYLSWQRYGQIVFDQFLALVNRITLEQRNNHSPFYYLWNTPVKAFPWPLFSILGIFVVLRRRTFAEKSYKLILIGYPLTILTVISLVSTRLPHYALILYPFLAMLAAVALDWLGKVYELDDFKYKGFVRNVSYAFGCLAILLLIAGIAIYSGILNVGTSEELDIQQASLLGVVLGLGWLSLPVLWFARHNLNKTNRKKLPANFWLAGLLIPSWLAIATAGCVGLLGNYSPDIKPFLQQKEVASVVQNNPINFVVKETEALTTGGDKALLLLTFYTPRWGKRYQQLSQLPPNSYAWVSSEFNLNSSPKYRSLARFRKWQLVSSK
jgi:4-amino-4-deoxy-L-arabinose transferase-like glycosyltransferase